MFRARNSGWSSGASVVGWLVLLLLLPALVLNLGSIYLVIRDHRMLGMLIERPETAPAAVVATLEREFNMRIASRLFVSAILILSAMAILTVRRTLRRFRLLADDILARMDKGVIAVDRAGTITGSNPAAIRLLGMAADPYGEPLARVVPADMPLPALVDQVHASGTRDGERDFAVERDGGTRLIRVDAHALEDLGGGSPGTILILSDVTRRHLAEQRVRRMEQIHGLDSLASGLLHEINNPLTVLEIHARLLEEHLTATGGSAESQELIGVLRSEIHRLVGILEGFRDYACPDNLTPRPADVSAIVEGVIRLIRPRAEQQRVRLVFRRPDAGVPPLPLDAERFEQAVLNLAINGLEAMPSGGALELAVAARDGSVVVEVSDTGPGIAPEIREDLFKPYVTTKRRGTGLGLALTEKLVGLHHGRIDVRSGPRGTTFAITLPLSPPEDLAP